MSGETLLAMEGLGLHAVARRNDRFFGHAVDVDLIREDGSLYRRLSFACHPDGVEFDRFQAMTTEQLYTEVAKRLPQIVDRIVAVLGDELPLLVRLNAYRDDL